MSISRKITGDASGGSGGSGKYVDDVFSTYLYEGDQTTSSRQIVNGIDLDDKGGLVWIKERSQDRFHFLYDTERGAGKWLNTNNADAEGTLSTEQLQSFNSDGFNLGDFYGVNETGEDFASWSFAKQEGFFDVVTYTGDGVAGREIAHNLGSVPGMVIVKCLNRDMNNRDWMVYHRSLNGGTTPENYYARLNLVNAESTSTAAWNDTAPTAQAFTLGNSNDTNENGYEYVAYLFAHDAPMFGPDGDESIIKCGGYTGTGVAGLEIDLGWEPQYVLLKSADDAFDWYMFDTMRGIVTDGNDSLLNPNTSNAESASGNRIEVTPTGFTISTGSQGWNKAGSQFIYMAIRRPMKPAEEFEPDELFAISGSDDSGTDNPPAYQSGFPVDMGLTTPYLRSNTDKDISSRLTAGSYLRTDSNGTNIVNDKFKFDYQEGWYTTSDSRHISWMWRRAPGFFDVVTYTGGQGTDAQIPHNLGARPEMLWVKSLSDASEWCVWSESYENTDQMLILNRADALSTSYFGSMPEVMTDEVFQIGGNAVYMNGAGKNYIAYLWASVPGICDIGTYTGTGDSQYIDCGLGASTPRFVLIKSTSEDGNWYYWDSLRGFDFSDNPYLMLNNNDTQVTNTRYIQPSQQSSGGITGGFYITSSSGSPIYKDGVEYIYMAIA